MLTNGTFIIHPDEDSVAFTESMQNQPRKRYHYSRSSQKSDIVDKI